MRTTYAAGVNAVADLELASSDFIAVMQYMISLPGIDPYQELRVMAKKANDQLMTWSLWLQGSSQLEVTGKWSEAMAWINEGLDMAPEEVRGSLYLQAGWISQVRADAPDHIPH